MLGGACSSATAHLITRSLNHSLDAFCRDWSFITSQIGMFTYTGCTPPQVENMTNKWHVYMTKDGRISLAGLSLSKCQWLAEAIDDSVRNH